MTPDPDDEHEAAFIAAIQPDAPLADIDRLIQLNEEIETDDDSITETHA